MQDPDGRVVSVEFREGDVVLGTVNEYPFRLVLQRDAECIPTRAILTDDDEDGGGGGCDHRGRAVNASPVVRTAQHQQMTQAVVAPYVIPLAVSIADWDGVITNVSYVAGGVKLGVVTNAPFSLNSSNAPVGIHSLTAVATDNLGLSTTSAPVTSPCSRPPGSPFSCRSSMPLILRRASRRWTMRPILLGAGGSEGGVRREHPDSRIR